MLTTPGVRKIVGIGRTPVPIPDSVIDAVRAGSLAGVEGVYTASRKHHRLVVTLELLHRSMAVEVDQTWVEAVGPTRLSAGRT